MSRAEEALARSRGNCLAYLPGDAVLVKDRKHPLFDERVNDPPDREMIESIKLFGVLQPPLVTRCVDDEGKPYIGVIVGKQRFINARVAEEELAKEGKQIPGRKPGHIECIMRNDFTPEELREVIIHENLKRREETFKNKVAKAERLLAAYKAEAEAEGAAWSEAAAMRRVAGHFGVTASVVKRWLEVRKLAPAARKAVITGEVALGLVDDLKDMSPENQEKAVDKAKASPTVGTRGARQASSEVPRAKPETQKRRTRKAVEAEIDKLRIVLADPLLDDKTKFYKEGALYGMRFAIADDGDDSAKTEEKHGPAPAPAKASLPPPRVQDLPPAAPEPTSDKEARVMALEEARGLCDQLQAGEGDLLGRLKPTEFIRLAAVAVELLPKSKPVKEISDRILRGTVGVDDVHELVDAIGKVRK